MKIFDLISNVPVSRKETPYNIVLSSPPPS
jgi:hypothetical protein